MSHWAVNDATTAKLMGYFYKYLAEGLQKDRALQLAKLEYLENADPAQSHPYYWGAFVVMGDNSPIVIRKRSNFWMYISMAFFVLFIFLYMRQKESNFLFRNKWGIKI